MSKGQRGNREVKKPKKKQAPAGPMAPDDSTPSGGAYYRADGA